MSKFPMSVSDQVFTIAYIEDLRTLQRILRTTPKPERRDACREVASRLMNEPEDLLGRIDTGAGLVALAAENTANILVGLMEDEK